MLVPLTVACLAAATHAYQIPQVYLYAILQQEGGHVGQMVANKNGTYDLGPFQINTVWGPAMAKYWRISEKQALERARDNGCANATVATAILRKYYLETKGDMHKAIGFYHSHTKELAESYRASVIARAVELSSPFRALPKPVVKVPNPKVLVKPPTPAQAQTLAKVEPVAKQPALPVTPRWK